jgi:quaternary ammonium compound-resistance protein SugE
MALSNGRNKKSRGFPFLSAGGPTLPAGVGLSMFGMGTTPIFSFLSGRPDHRVELTMNWIVLVVAGLFETGWAVGLKYTEGFTRPLPSVLTAVSMILSLGLLGMALRSLPLGTAYAVWTGIGAVGTVLVGIVMFGESADAVRLLCIGLILAGILGLKFVTP